MNVYEYLEQVKELDKKVEARLWERRQLLDMATRLGADYDGMPKGKGGYSDPVGEGAVKLAELAREIDRAVDLFVDTKEAVVAMLARLPRDEYEVLHRYYVRYKEHPTWDAVCEAMHYSYTSVWRIKCRAIAHLEELLSLENAKDEIV